MPFKTTLSSALLLSLIAAHCYLYAGETLDLGEIIVTPFRTDVAVSANPASIDIIDVETDIPAGLYSLSDAVQDSSSISTATSGGLGGETALFIRGADSDHTQVLFNGIRLYDPAVTSAYFYAFNYMSLDNLERIEVVKGPYSSLYGSDSIGGTINLISKKGEGEPALSYTQTVGSYQTCRELLQGQGTKDRLAYAFSIARTDVNASYAGRYKDGNHETDPYHDTATSLRLDYDVDDDTAITLVTDYTRAKYEYDQSGGTDSDEYYAYFDQGIAGLTFDQKLTDSFRYKAIAGYTRTYRKDWSWGSSTFFNGITYQAKWQGEYTLNQWWKAITGIDYLREQSESTWSAKETADTKGYFLEQILTPVEDLFISGAWRIEDHSRFEHHSVFNFGASYTIEETGTKLKTSWGEGFKAPSLYQLFSSYGDPDLNPEESESYEFGAEQKIGNNITVSSTYFNTHVKNLIQYRNLGAYPWGEYYQDGGKAEIHGLENTLTYTVDDTLSVSLGYTAMDTEDKTDGTRLDRRPDNKAGISLRKEIGRLTISPDITYVGNRIDGTEKLKSYYLANISLVYSVSDSWETFLRVENLFDQEYETVNGYETPDLSVYTGFKVSF